MVKLSDRLQLIADHIEKGETMADIGTDHGFLPLYLVENGISPKAILCDISGPSLNKARALAEEMASAGVDVKARVDFREGNGLAVLDDGEVDAVVIAGMGGVLITEILGGEPDRTLGIGKYIVQPRNNAAFLRFWLASRGFATEKNLLVREGNHICEVIVAIPHKRLENGDFALSEALAPEDDPRWDMPEALYAEEPGLVGAFAALKLRQAEKRRNGLRQGRNTDVVQIRKAEAHIDYFRRYLNDEL